MCMHSWCSGLWLISAFRLCNFISVLWIPDITSSIFRSFSFFRDEFDDRFRNCLAMLNYALPHASPQGFQTFLNKVFDFIFHVT